MYNKSLFIVTKPLQYLNAVNIEDNSQHKICSMCNQFKDADKFLELCKKIGPFDEYIFNKNKNLALLYWIFHQHGIKKIYMDADYGFLKRFLLLFFLDKKIYVYEEGYASYTPLRKPNSIKNKLGLLIARLLNIRNFSGGSSKVSGIYLYYPDKFIAQFGDVKKELLSFKLPFKDNVLQSRELEEQSKIINFNLFKGRDVLIYLSSWAISDKAINYCLGKKDEYLCVLKLHPHIKEDVRELKELFDVNLPNNLIFEYIFFRIYSEANNILIVHHGTYAVRFINFKDDSKVDEVVIPF